MTKKLKLRGQVVKNMSLKEKKEKQKVLDRMIETRKKDDKWLRDQLQLKLTWATQERQKGLNLIEQTKIKVYKLTGMMILINDVLNLKKEEK